MDKHIKLKLRVMKALQDDEERQLQNDLLGALIEDATPEELPAPQMVREIAEKAPEQLQAPIVPEPQAMSITAEELTKDDPKAEEN